MSETSERGQTGETGEGAARLEQLFGGISSSVRRILEGALAGRDLSVEDAVRLCGVSGRELHALCMTADRLRAEQAGDVVTYVVNRNINFTNVCTKACRFCAFSRTQRSDEGYLLPEEEVVRRAVQAHALGATEVCIQAGLLPGMRGDVYPSLCRALKKALPSIHIHAFSPEEIKYGAGLSGMSFREYLAELKDAGLGSLPGTSAEILDDKVRARIAPGRITTAEWIEVIESAHALGLPTTSTIMWGHVETDAERMRHLDLLRSMQRSTRGFTEFVPLSFVHQEAPMFLKGTLAGLRGGPSGNDVLRLYALARLMLGADFRNIQVSWVKEGLREAQWMLGCGANDLGGTLMNESISTSAGAAHGQLVAPSALRRLIREAGRVPAARNTKYEILRAFSSDGSDDEIEPLDQVDDVEATFGSYQALTENVQFRWRRPSV